MQINIRIMLSIEGNRSLIFANPNVKMNRFREDPNREAARWAYARIRENSRETGHDSVHSGCCVQ
jgi:hypothetical protein